MRTAACYIGGYIGDDVSRGVWLKNRTDKWERDICTLRKMADKYPQESYAALDRAVQSERIFLQCLTKYTGQAFKNPENFLQKTFLPFLLFGKPKTFPPIVRALSKLPVKKYGLSLHNPMTSAKGEIQQFSTCRQQADW